MVLSSTILLAPGCRWGLDMLPWSRFTSARTCRNESEYGLTVPSRKGLLKPIVHTAVPFWRQGLPAHSQGYFCVPEPSGGVRPPQVIGVLSTER